MNFNVLLIQIQQLPPFCHSFIFYTFTYSPLSLNLFFVFKVNFSYVGMHKCQLYSFDQFGSFRNPHLYCDTDHFYLPKFPCIPSQLPHKRNHYSMYPSYSNFACSVISNKWTHGMFCSYPASFTPHNIFDIHLCCCMQQYLILFYGQIIFRCMDMPLSSYLLAVTVIQFYLGAEKKSTDSMTWKVISITQLGTRGVGHVTIAIFRRYFLPQSPFWPQELTAFPHTKYTQPLSQEP